MINITQNQQFRARSDRRIRLINELYKLDYKPNGKPIESMNLAELEQVHINEKCRAVQ